MKYPRLGCVLKSFIDHMQQSENKDENYIEGNNQKFPSMHIYVGVTLKKLMEQHFQILKECLGCLLYCT